VSAVTSDHFGTRELDSVAVLLVDDNPAKRLALRAALQSLGIEVVEAESGTAALRCVAAQDFAVILLDVRMPVMDGFETAALIRQRRQSELTPIIFITAFGSEDLRTADRYVEGAVDFMFAPVDPVELRSKVSALAKLHVRAEVAASEVRRAESVAEQLRQLIDLAPVAIFQMDADDRFAYTNARWSQLTAVAAADAMGKTWDELFGQVGDDVSMAGPPAVAGTYRVLLTGRSGPRPFVITVEPVADGSPGWVGTLSEELEA
jgi:CheY-like chemotaxis protein